MDRWAINKKTVSPRKYSAFVCAGINDLCLRKLNLTKPYCWLFHHFFRFSFLAKFWRAYFTRISSGEVKQCLPSSVVHEGVLCHPMRLLVLPTRSSTSAPFASWKTSTVTNLFHFGWCLWLKRKSILSCQYVILFTSCCALLHNEKGHCHDIILLETYKAMLWFS